MPITKRGLGFWSSLLAAPHTAGAATVPPAAERAAQASDGQAELAPKQTPQAATVSTRPSRKPLSTAQSQQRMADVDKEPWDFTGSRPVSEWPPAWML